MSISANIEFFFPEKIKPILVIETLISSGWTINDNGHISFLPVGDNDEYNWEWCDINKWETVDAIIDKKEKNGETIGLALTWKDTNIGGNVLFWKSREEFCFSLTSNRKKIGGDNLYTDFSWYLDKLITVLCNAEIQPEKIICEHIN
jgi:hypothetical protein